MIDESMDVALSKTCNHFDEDYYSRIQTAYRLMGKTQVCPMFNFLMFNVQCSISLSSLSVYCIFSRIIHVCNVI